MLRLQGGEAPALLLDISLFLFLILYQGVYRLYRGVCKLHPPAFDDCGSVSMQNDECKMQNEGISFGNDYNLSAKRTPQFFILLSALYYTTPDFRTFPP